MKSDIASVKDHMVSMSFCCFKFWHCVGSNPHILVGAHPRFWYGSKSETRREEPTQNQTWQRKIPANGGCNGCNGKMNCNQIMGDFPFPCLNTGGYPSCSRRLFSET